MKETGFVAMMERLIFANRKIVLGLFAVITDVMDRHDVRMVAQPPHRLRLPPHALQTSFVQPLGLDDGDRYVSVEAVIVCKIDLLTAAFAQEAFDIVPSTRERCRERGGGLGGRGAIRCRRFI